MSDRVLRAGIAVLALLGVAVSGYLLSARYAGTELLCRTGGCETVQSSPYSELVGLPVAGVGILGFLLIGATALGRRPQIRAAAAGLALGALAFSGYLLIVQLAVIGAVCDWCVAADAVTTVLAGLTILRLPGSPASPARARGGRARPGSRAGASA